ncbi:hypothetical protein B0G57_12376 [Trinickia symbiotica]|nr:hypothetical protein B0G57_12376 [Trinickia symbiotica]
MKSVKIDLGFGDEAFLSDRAISGIPAAKHQRDAEEFLRRWPQTRSLHQARGYLQQLGLHVTYKPPGVNPSDTVALLRWAVKSGRIMVAIERATARSGGRVGAIQPTFRRAPIEPSRQSFAEMAESRTHVSATLDDAVSTRTLHSWLSALSSMSVISTCAMRSRVLWGALEAWRCANSRLS